MTRRDLIAQVAAALLLAMFVIAGDGLAAEKGRNPKAAARTAAQRSASTAVRPNPSDSPSPVTDQREPLSLDEVEIHGELLVPQAVYIVAGAEDDSAAAAGVHDYLDDLPGCERIGLFLIVDESVAGAPSLSNPPGTRASPAAAEDGR